MAVHMQQNFHRHGRPGSGMQDLFAYGRLFKLNKHNKTYKGNIGDFFSNDKKYYYEPQQASLPEIISMYKFDYFLDPNLLLYFGQSGDSFSHDLSHYKDACGVTHTRDEYGWYRNTVTGDVMNIFGQIYNANGEVIDNNCLCVDFKYLEQWKSWCSPKGQVGHNVHVSSEHESSNRDACRSNEVQNHDGSRNRRDSTHRDGFKNRDGSTHRDGSRHRDGSGNRDGPSVSRSGDSYEGRSERRPLDGKEQGGQRGQLRSGEYDGRQSNRQWTDDRSGAGSGQAGYGKERKDNPDFFLSKKLSFLLRHGAEKQGFKLLPGGFLYVNEILSKDMFKRFTEKDVIRIVEENDKQRFALKPDEQGHLMIRANQGHTIEVEDLELTPILNKEDVKVCIHGTYFNCWESIQKSGLNRMSRNHIHFAEGEPNSQGVISGMRGTCEIMIFVDVGLALHDGIKFFRSANGVILSPGNSEGSIAPYYFQHVLQRSPRQMIMFEKISPHDLAAVSSKKKKGKKSKKSKLGKEENKGDNSEIQQQSMAVDEKAGEIAMETKPVPVEGKDKEEEEEEAAAAATANPAAIPESWDDHGENEAAAEDMETEQIMESLDDQIKKEEIALNDEEAGKCAVEDIEKSKCPVAVVCYGVMSDKMNNNGRVKQILCVVPGKAYIFNVNEKEFLNEIGLIHLLESKDIPKAFFGIAGISKTLFDQFRIILDGSDVYDTKVVFELMKESEWGNMEELNSLGFDPRKWRALAPKAINDKNANEEIEIARCILKAYEYMNKEVEKKKVKKEIFDEVNSLIDKSELKMIKTKKKKDKKQK